MLSATRTLQIMHSTKSSPSTRRNDVHLASWPSAVHSPSEGNNASVGASISPNRTASWRPKKRHAQWDTKLLYLCVHVYVCVCDRSTQTFMCRHRRINATCILASIPSVQLKTSALYMHLCSTQKSDVSFCKANERSSKQLNKQPSCWHSESDAFC